MTNKTVINLYTIENQNTMLNVYTVIILLTISK